MEDLQTILDRVLAGVGEMVAEKRKAIRGQVGEVGGLLDQATSHGENTSAGTRPLPVVSQTGGGKSPRQAIDDLNCLHRPMKGGHEKATAAIQTTTGVAITAYEIRK